MKRIFGIIIVISFVFVSAVPVAVEAWSWGNDHQEGIRIINDTDCAVNIVLLYNVSIFFGRPDKYEVSIKPHSSKKITYYKEDYVRHKYIKVNGKKKYKVQSGVAYNISEM